MLCTSLLAAHRFVCDGPCVRKFNQVGLTIRARLRLCSRFMGRTPTLSLPLSASTSTPSLTKSNFFLLCNTSNDFSLLNLYLYDFGIWDVGGQNTIPSYWRNYFEQTDGLVYSSNLNYRRLDDYNIGAP